MGASAKKDDDENTSFMEMVLMLSAEAAGSFAAGFLVGL